MEHKVSMILASHLSDAQHEIGSSNLHVQLNRRLNFVKYLIFNFPNTDIYIDPNVEWEKFKVACPYCFESESITTED